MILLPIRLDQPQSRFPLATTGLAVAQVVAFLFTYIPGDFDRVQLQWGFMPQYESLSTLFTHMFLHDGYLHLLGNLIMFVLPGMKVEDAIGSLRFLGFFLSCGIVALMAHVWMAGTLPMALVGSSGAVSGVIGAFMFLYPNSMISFLIFPFPIVIRLRAWFFLGLWILKEIIQGYLLRVSGTDSPVAIWAHVGGFAFGALSMWCFFGWDGGLGGELRLGALRFLRSMRGKIFKRRRINRYLGVALQAIPLIYAVMVFDRGGLVHALRMEDPQEQRNVLAREIAVHQSAQALFEKALQAGTDSNPMTRNRLKEFHDYLDNPSSELQMMRQRAAGTALPPSGMTGQVDRFFREEFPKFPEKCQIGIEGVVPLSVLYTSGLKYWIFCGTNLGSQEVFTSYLEVLDERDWAVQGPLFDPERKAGIMTSFDGEWALEIVVSLSDDWKYKTHVLWRLEKIGN